MAVDVTAVFCGDVQGATHRTLAQWTGQGGLTLGQQRIVELSIEHGGLGFLPVKDAGLEPNMEAPPREIVGNARVSPAGRSATAISKHLQILPRQELYECLEPFCPPETTDTPSKALKGCRDWGTGYTHCSPHH